jgi:GT2 family glycosyltransferase
MSSIDIAVLITCHNRKLKTLSCLDALFKQNLPASTNIDVYLVDDGSTDGTETAVRQTYPQIKIFKGDGGLFWNRGMRWAFAEAIEADYDFYFWLNDDTNLYPQALETLLTNYKNLLQSGKSKSILVGSTQDPVTKNISYGGLVRCSWWHPLKFELLEPDKQKLIACDTINGNCVLIPREVVAIVGNIESTFVHSSGDWDYGLRAKQNGVLNWIAPNYLGTCAPNSQRGTWMDGTLSVSERFKKVFQPKGLPFGEWRLFSQRHAGMLWFFYCWLPYMRLIFLPILPKAKLGRF